jgi:hypothetical protein
MEISWTGRVRKKYYIPLIKAERLILHTLKRRKANWIGHNLRRNYLQKLVIEGTVEGRIRSDGKTREKT